ncbi:MAG: OmpA family protein [Crocinitomicaceae bacterium]|nr:OmpA family protein [Crocinitomicaceae bacterium]
MNSCFGAINIFESGDFQLQFTGEKSNNIIEPYGSLSDIEVSNQLWCAFIAPAGGELTFEASKKTGFVQMVVFAEEQGDICGEIANGSAEIKRLHSKKDVSTVGLSNEIDDGVLYTLKMYEGEKIYVLFTTEEKSTDKLKLKWTFTHDKKHDSEVKIVDKRNDDFAPTFSIEIRDKYTNEPLVANVTIEGSKSFDALYVGSDLFFSIQRNCKLKIRCDVEGYFFVDIIDEQISSSEDYVMVILLEEIASGRSVKIERVEFTPGTSQLVSSSEPKLKRLKDFLALNSDIDIEIQGHVFALGDNSFVGQRISEARAKRVMKYLVDQGIDRSRLKAVGYGNTQPLFPEPQFFYEEQANRRVEIVVR